jgi:CheY-like chemotaxis protein
MEPMLRRVLRESVQLETRYDPGCWPVFIDPGQLEQVLLNLAVNARDAMPRGGRLAVTVENTTLEPEGAAPLELEPGGYVRLTARDDGVGMEPEVCSRVFEPFFTTKEGRSFGLGLSTCYGIVRQAGGAISVTSAPGAGATFRVHLPRTTAARPVAASEVAEPKTTRGTETVIIVEDEPSVRRIAVRALSSLGYRVLEAETRAAAEALFGDHVGPIEAAILDVALPDGNGRDVAATLARTRPQSRVLFVSGYAGDLAGPHGVLDPSVAFLPKPYTPEQLARRLRALLDSDAATT